ncbi:hypothetical protein L218DRAFT_960462 [Marasmius fiardii PR-910]|nr:hypothetical protein L218DRAFT_960462 [Marasmius fiardii PR-910]
MSATLSCSLWPSTSSTFRLTSTSGYGLPSKTLLLRRYAYTYAKKARRTSEPKAVENKDKEVSDEDAAAGIQQVTLQMQNDPQWDPWAQPIATLDVVLPYRTAPWSGSSYGSIKARLQQMWNNRLNALKNSFNKSIMLRYNSFPGVDMDELGGMNYFLKVPVQILSGTKSAAKPSSWLFGLRNEILESYCDAQKAIANKDRITLSSYAQSHYLSDCTRFLRKQAPTARYIWNLHASDPTTSTELPPNNKTTILSIRAIEGHLGRSPPPGGNRLCIQVLAKVETLQSLEIYDASGKALHAPSPMLQTDPHQRPVINTSAAKNFRHKRTPADPHPQTEYLIFEKKMYMPGQKWSIRERVYPREGAIVAL